VKPREFFPSSPVGLSSFLCSSFFSCSLPSSSPYSFPSFFSFLPSSPPSSALSQQAPSVLVPLMSRPSTLLSWRAIAGREWLSLLSSAPYSVAYTASAGTSNIPPTQNRPCGELRRWPLRLSHSSSCQLTSFWPRGTSVLAKSSNAEPCSFSTSPWPSSSLSMCQYVYPLSHKLLLCSETNLRMPSLPLIGQNMSPTSFLNINVVLSLHSFSFWFSTPFVCIMIYW